MSQVSLKDDLNQLFHTNLNQWEQVKQIQKNWYIFVDKKMLIYKLIYINCRFKDKQALAHIHTTFYNSAVYGKKAMIFFCCFFFKLFSDKILRDKHTFKQVRQNGRSKQQCVICFVFTI